MNPKEVAKYSGLSSMSIYRYIKQGKIPVSRVGGVWRFRKERLIEWLKRQEKVR